MNVTRLRSFCNNNIPQDKCSLMFFGDGSDGSVTIASGTTTLARDMFYDFLTVNSGANLKTNGFKVFVRTEAIIDGTVHNDATGWL